MFVLIAVFLGDGDITALTLVNRLLFDVFMPVKLERSIHTRWFLPFVGECSKLTGFHTSDFLQHCEWHVRRLRLNMLSVAVWAVTAPPRTTENIATNAPWATPVPAPLSVVEICAPSAWAVAS